MRIALISRHRPHIGCGVGDYTGLLAEALAQKGHDVHVFTSEETAPAAKPSAYQLHPTVPSWGFRGLFSLARQLKSIKPDLMGLQYVPHAYGPYGVNPFLPLAMLGLRLYVGVPIVLTGHELFLRLAGRWRRWPVVLFHRFQLAVLMVASSRFVLVTEQQKKELSGLFSLLCPPLSVIPVGPSFAPTSLSEQGREELRRRVDPAATLWVGSFFSAVDVSLIERQMTLVDRLRKKGWAIRLLLLGGISPVLLKSVPSWVTITGFLPEVELSKHLQILDVLLALKPEGPTTRNTALITALAHGVPALALQSDFSDAEFWKNSGVLLVPDQELALQEAAERLLKDAAERHRLSRAAADFSRSHFDWPQISDLMEKTYTGERKAA